ncbi:carbohydrate-binding protein [Streptomyces phytohabitans]|uniref:carbohydrate-binding protein n=1 Tax=Streptomyces phytohabitans TaxID=1150371 RepID=UPI00345BFE7B
MNEYEKPLPRRPRRFPRRAVLAGAFASALPLGLPLAAGPARAAGSGRAVSSGATVTVDADGGYAVETTAPRYRFAGSVGSPVRDVRRTEGQDGVGPYAEVEFGHTAEGVDRTSAIRTYDDSPVVLFRTEYHQEAANSAPFPAFSEAPALAHHETYDSCFAKHRFDLEVDGVFGPYLAFDGSGGGYLFSPASHFPTAVTWAAGTSLTGGTSRDIARLPAGFTQRTVLAFGSDVNEVYDVWGHALTGLSGKRRPAQDASHTLATLGYWTDNGATYYYDFDPDLGYAGTLRAVRERWREQGLPMGNLQLDSWFYPKGPDASWSDIEHGEWRYEADASLFPDGLRAFQESVGVPLVTHARWIDASSPYRDEYAMSGNVVVDRAFWDDRMRYLRESGVDTFEQDWLCDDAQPDFNLTDREAFLDNMAAATAANGMDVQYCMPLVQDFLHSTLFDNVTNTRVSDDRFERTKWDRFLYTSRLASAVGTWPFADVVMSDETRNLLLQNLSAGLVGVGDRIGRESAANLRRVALPDGTVVKPDTPLVPDTATYVRDASGGNGPMVATTRSRHGETTAAYVYAYARAVPDTAPDAVYQAEDATLSGPVVAAEHAGHTGSGYADFQHADGDHVEWDVEVPADGTYTLLFRYANHSGEGRPSGDDRPLAVTVDGGEPTAAPFMPTGGWDRWEEQPVVVELAAGAHTVRATATGRNGPNLDRLGVTAGRAGTVDAAFRPADAGVAGEVYVYDWFAGKGRTADGGSTYTVPVTRDGTYLQVVPVGRSGIAFLGDAGKFVSRGGQRIAELADDGAVRAVVAFAEGEDAVTLRGYATGAVAASATGGEAGEVAHDPDTGLFTVEVTPAGGAASVTVTLTAG